MRHDIRQLTDELKNRINVESFIEIGSRDGHDTHYIRQYWNINPNKCYIIEAHPECYMYIVETYPQYNILNIAASNVTGIVKFNAGIVGVEGNVGTSSMLVRSSGDFISKEVEVDAWKMLDVLDYFKIESIDLAKIDVEGVGLQVLQGFEHKLRKFKAIQIELEQVQVWNEQILYNDVVTFMKESGFSVLDDVDLDGIQRDVLFINEN